jgi:hypothetical protein
MGTNWWTFGQEWLIKRAQLESMVQYRAHLKRGRRASTFRYHPPQWHRDMVTALGENDEAGFKYLKLQNIAGLNCE